MTQNYDAVVVGGGAAGFSGALALARSLRSVLVIDAGDPRNAPAGHVHNFLTRDGTPPAGITAAGRAEVEGYGGTVVDGRVTALAREGEGFRVDYEAAGAPVTVHARRLLAATGARDELPQIPGLAERWGIDVLHCPYCHGWEVRGRRIGILATGPMAMHQALLFRQLSEHITVLQHTAEAFTEEQRQQFEALGITLVEGAVTAVESGADGLTGVRLADGSAVPLDALAVATVARARAELLAPLGLEPVDFAAGGALMGTRIETDAMGATAAAGVWAAGNVADVAAQVITSAADGLRAGAAINADLVMADAAEARYEHVFGQSAWDARYGEHGGHGHGAHDGQDGAHPHGTEHGGKGHAGHMWSGRPNAVVVAELEHLAPGTAFDAGAGEGGDALWLAEHGWTVTAADLSPIALERGARLAEQRGVTVDWRHLDLTREPVPGTFDLVTASYLHIPADRRAGMFARLAEAVAPGGTLLIIGHHPDDAHTGVRRPDLSEIGWTAEDLAATLGDGWVLDTCEARSRVERFDGADITVQDAVLRARRAG